jgi:hypothetical protein
MNQIRNATKAMTAIPPMTPPAIAPTGVLEEEWEPMIGLEVEVDELALPPSVTVEVLKFGVNVCPPEAPEDAVT